MIRHIVSTDPRYLWRAQFDDETGAMVETHDSSGRPYAHPVSVALDREAVQANLDAQLWKELAPEPETPPETPPETAGDYW